MIKRNSDQISLVEENNDLLEVGQVSMEQVQFMPIVITKSSTFFNTVSV
jgi:hypothetical protein